MITDAHCPNAMSVGWAEGLVAVANQMTWRFVPGESVSHLPSNPLGSFWDYFRNAWMRDAGLRIDHLLLSPSAAARLVSAGVDREVRGWQRASDHGPTWI